MVEKIEFDGRTAARPTRKDPKIKPFLADQDDARTGTVVLKDGTPERVVEKVAGEAAETREKNASKFGQTELTERERKEIDFQKTDVPTARAVKGIANGMGVSDWLSYFDEELTVDENRENMRRAKREGGGRRNRGRETGQNAKRLAQANKARKDQADDRLKDFALLKQDDAAQEELDTRPGSIGDVFDIAFTRGQQALQGSGGDFERLQDRHEQRSERAQRQDERRSAKVTRDPVQWANNPAQYDFPGVDTVQPQQLHEQRSERAQRQDEREVAPIADSRQQWAQNSDRYDWPGVDRPRTFGPTMERSPPSPERNTNAPGALTAGLSNQDVSLSPEEAFEGVGTGSLDTSNLFTEFAADEEADRAFVQAEDQRSESGGLLETESSSQAGLGGDVVESDQQSAFALETDVREAQGRESRQDVAQASEFGVDDRELDNSGTDEGDQSGLEVFGGGSKDNETLF
jgi:hypothetical protein